ERPRDALGISNQETRAKIAHMDTIITGFGSADMYTFLSVFFKAWLDPREIDELLSHVKRDLVVGDIGGHFVPSAIGRDDDALIRFLLEINRRIPAAQPSDFRHVASTHVKTHKGGGVVGVTVGARK